MDSQTLRKNKRSLGNKLESGILKGINEYRICWNMKENQYLRTFPIKSIWLGIQKMNLLSRSMSKTVDYGFDGFYENTMK